MPNGPTPEQIPKPVGDPPPYTKPAPDPDPLQTPQPIQDPQAAKPDLEPLPGDISAPNTKQQHTPDDPDPEPVFPQGVE